jgi:hypothetical protein
MDAALEPDALYARFRELQVEGTTQRLMDRALAGVVAWSWTGGQQIWSGTERVEPFWRERHDLRRRAKEIPGPAPILSPAAMALRPADAPMNGNTFREFGRSREGRLLITRLVAEDATGPWAWHLRENDGNSAEVWVSGIESFQVSSGAIRLGSVRRTAWENGQIIASACYSHIGQKSAWEAERYFYADGQLDAVLAWGKWRSEPGGTAVWEPYPRTEFWTVEPGGRKVRSRPASASLAPQLSETELDALERDYLEAAVATVGPVAEMAWLHHRDWIAEHPPAADERADLSVCFIRIPAGSNGLPRLGGCRVLTVQERGSLRARRTYKPLDAYVKPEGSGLGARDHPAELLRVDPLARTLSDELHSRRDDARFQRVNRELVQRVSPTDWSARFPITKDLLIATVDDEATLKKRREQLEHNLSHERFSALLEEENAVITASKDLPEPIKLSRAHRALMTAITAHQHAGRVSVSGLCEAFGAFVKVPIAGCEPTTDADLVLVEWSNDQRHSHLLLTRQLTPEGPGGEYAGMHVFILDITLPAQTLAAFANDSAWVTPGSAFASLHTGQVFEVITSARKSEPAGWEVTDNPV